MKRLLLVLALQLMIYIGWAADYKAHLENGKYGYKNEAGEWAIDPQFDVALDFSSGVGLVIIANKYGLIDEHGEYLVPCEWDGLNYIYYNELGIIGVTKAGLQGVIRPREGFITPCIWEEAELFGYRYGYIVVKKDGKYGAIDVNGRIVLACEFDAVDINQWSYFHVTKAGKKGLYDKDGNQLAPCKYESTWFYPDDRGLLNVVLNAKHGLCNSKGEEIIPCRYDDICFIESFAGYLVQIKSSVKPTEGVYRVDGTELIPCIYNEIIKRDYGFIVELNGNRSYLDTNGKPMEDPNKNIEVDLEGGDIAGTWSYSIDFNKQTVNLEGDRIVNRSKTLSTGKMKLCYYLTTTRYQGGSISGYILAECALNPLKPEQYYSINHTLDFKNSPPDGLYYQTLCLLEDNGSGYYIQDYMNFDKQLNFIRVNKWDAFSQALQNFGNTLNSINGITTPQQPGIYPAPQSKGQMVKVTCNSCRGTGWNAGKEYPPSYGLGIQYKDYACETCGSYEVHYHKKCMLCSGRGYTEKWVP